MVKFESILVTIMHWIKSFILCSLIVMLNVKGDILTNDETSHGISTPIPIVLQMSTQYIEFKNLQSSATESNVNKTLKEVPFNAKENIEILQEHQNNADKKLTNNNNNQQKISNDIEVFEHKQGPKMEKQEEPEAEPEAEQTAAEDETKDDTAEPETNPEPAADEEPTDNVAEPVAESEPEAEPEPGADNEPEAEPEPVAENEPEEEGIPAADAEPQSEPAAGEEIEQPEEANKEETPPENQEQDMPNDEPAQEGEPASPAKDAPTTQVAGEQKEPSEEANKEESPPENHEPAKEGEPATHAVDDKPATEGPKNKKAISCFTCTSSDDLKCNTKPTQQENCSKANSGESEKHSGCYTLYKTDTNMTMRGCVDDLAEEGLKYCLTNDKLCLLCYKNGCNNKLAPSTAALQQLNVYLMLFLSGFSTISITKKIFIYSFN